MVLMAAGVVHNWPREIGQLLASLKANAERRDSYFAVADVTRDELTTVALFEVAARNGRVCFGEPSSPTRLVGCMNPIVGLGRPGSSSQAAKIRISFHDVSAE
jgi:hypothetical protein